MDTTCPLPTIHEEDLYQGVDSLLPKCRKCKCWYVESSFESERQPSSCILIVVALLDKKRRAKDESNDKRRL